MPYHMYDYVIEEFQSTTISNNDTILAKYKFTKFYARKYFMIYSIYVVLYATKTDDEIKISS